MTKSKENKMDAQTAMEKTGKSVANNYENLLHKYHPAITKMIAAAVDIDQCLFDLARAQSVYLKNLSDVKAIAESSGVNDSVVDNIGEVHNLFNKINLEFTDFQKVFSADLVHPFESKLATDQTYLESELSGFRDNWNSAMTDLTTKEKSLSKLQKNRGKSKKDDQKRLTLEADIIDRKKQMDSYAQYNLKKSMVEQNRRFSYIAEKHKAHCKKMLLFSEQNTEIIRSQIENINLDNLNIEQDAKNAIAQMAPRKSIYEEPTDRRAHSVISPKPNSPPPPVVQDDYKAPQNGKKRVKASHNYGGDGKTKLHLEIGDTVQLLIPQPRDGWHYGENERTGERGWFPIQYTAKVDSNGLRRM